MTLNHNPLIQKIFTWLNAVCQEGQVGFVIFENAHIALDYSPKAVCCTHLRLVFFFAEHGCVNSGDYSLLSIKNALGRPQRIRQQGSSLCVLLEELQPHSQP
ncbi:hypothetical protein GOODEAATRI_013326 [Goodea atripinnis]|uniref:Uncharacterized protein n=1 Tax=Goodea atripinnis TaxID=208336 RepID=A0ABV0MRQ8_9TELE